MKELWMLYRGNDIVGDIYSVVNSMGYRVVAPVKYSGKYHVLSYVDDPRQIDLYYVRTINSPKHFLYPCSERIYRWFVKEGTIVFDDSMEVSKIAFLGIKPCDANAIYVLDRVLLDGEYIDPYYYIRRSNSIVVVFDCLLHDEYCFCESVNARIPRAYDIWVVGENNVYVSCKSSIGCSIIDSIGKDLFKPIEKPKIKTLGTNRINSEALRILSESYDSKKWIEWSKKCLLCGGCTASCPTCTCFDVVEYVSGLSEGERVREWTSCILRSFTVVAGGRIVRKKPDERFKFRYYHKFVFSINRYSIYFCVGCGRCSQQCPARINMVNVVNSFGNQS